LQVEHAHRRRQSQPDHKANPRDQLVMPAHRALDAQEIAIAKIFDPRVVASADRARDMVNGRVWPRTSAPEVAPHER
jgi:hypothetical protein